MVRAKPKPLTWLLTAGVVAIGGAGGAALSKRGPVPVVSGVCAWPDPEAGAGAYRLEVGLRAEVSPGLVATARAEGGSRDPCLTAVWHEANPAAGTLVGLCGWPGQDGAGWHGETAVQGPGDERAARGEVALSAAGSACLGKVAGALRAVWRKAPKR